jgi:hypothetical protein
LIAIVGSRRSRTAIAIVRPRLPRSARRSVRATLVSILRRRSPWALFLLFTIVRLRLARFARVRFGLDHVAPRAFLEPRALDVAWDLETIPRVLVLSAGTPVAATPILARGRAGIAEATPAFLGRLFFRLP